MNFRSLFSLESRSHTVAWAALLLAGLQLDACGGSKSKTTDGSNAGAGDTTGNAGSGESGNAGSGAGGSQNGAGGAQTGSGGSQSEGGNGGLPLASGGSAGVTVPPAIPVVPDPAKDCGVTGVDPAVPELKLTPFVDGFTRPVYLTQPRGESSRLFVVEKVGTIRIVRDGVLVDTPFLDIQSLVNERYEEMGLLGLAFHPNYANNGRFYVYYANVTGDASVRRLVEYTRSSDDPDLANPDSARVLLEFDHPENNHNGGNLQFGSDGFLYLGVGDGGGGGDQHGTSGNGQNLSTYLGKMLRFDVDGSGAGPNQAYAIPAGNLTGSGTMPEIWSYGLRNPWRYSFDACTGDMYIGDVGQDEIEEIDFEPAQNGGRNYGWRMMEGDQCFNPDRGCDAAMQNLILPVAQYDHGTGQSITGGYVYRGQAIPDLRGTYLYADYESARFYALRIRGGVLTVQQTEITSNINSGRDVGHVASFGQDQAGELYVVNFDGAIFRIDAK